MLELSREEWLKIAPVIVATLVALTGWIFTYFHKWFFDRKTNQLDRINRQLRELYGPLYISLKTATKIWESFTNKYWPKHGKKYYFDRKADLTDEEKKRWCTWMKHVFLPLHKRIETVVLESSDLFEGGEIPESILKALSHVAAYKAVIAQWEEGDYSEFLSVNAWPSDELISDIEPVYIRLLHKQQKLLGTSHNKKLKRDDAKAPPLS